MKHNKVPSSTVLLIDDDLISLVLSLILQLQVTATVFDCDVAESLLLGGVRVSRFLTMQREGALGVLEG